MSLSQDLHKEIENGRNGKSGIIPIHYDRLKDYIEIAKNTMYVLGGETGSAKSTCAHDLFLIRPIQWYLKNKTPDIKLSVIYFGMERKQYNYSARWISRLIFEEQGIVMSAKKILGRTKKDQLTDKEFELVQEYYKVLDEWEKDDILIAHQGSKNPTGISLYLEAFAKKHGTIHQKDKEERNIDNILETKTYVPNHPNHIVLVITDHIGILAPEKTTINDKGQIDKFSRCMRESRDLYGFSPVIIQQLNRNLADVTRQKLGDLVPKLSDFAGSSSTSHDSDVIIALFDPYRHTIGGELGKDNGYDLKRLKDDKFRTYYRSLHILKNSFDSSGFQFPIALEPQMGMMKILPRKDQITDDIYTSVTSGNYFLD